MHEAAPASSRADTIGSSADAVRMTTALAGCDVAYRAGRLDAVEVGKPVVDDDDVRRCRCTRLESGAPVTHRRDDAYVAVQPEQDLERFAKDGVVLDDEDVDRHASSIATPSASGLNSRLGH